MWISLNQELPEWYKDVIIKTDEGDVLSKWHLLSSGEFEYFGSLTSNRIILATRVTHWKRIE